MYCMNYRDYEPYSYSEILSCFISRSDTPAGRTLITQYVAYKPKLSKLHRR